MLPPTLVLNFGMIGARRALPVRQITYFAPTEIRLSLNFAACEVSHDIGCSSIETDYIKAATIIRVSDAEAVAHHTDDNQLCTNTHLLTVIAQGLHRMETWDLPMSPNLCRQRKFQL